jgi:ATP-dependent Clp protease ATP-binding subunit ClpB
VPLDPNRFTRKTQEALAAAQRDASERHHSQVTPEHLLAALVGQPEGVVLGVLERIGLAPTTVRARIDAALGAMPQVYGATTQSPSLAPETLRVLEQGDVERTDLSDDYLST